jgi:hypothetical protein
MTEYHQSRAWFLAAAVNWQERAARMHANAAYWLSQMPGTAYQRYACDAQREAAHSAEMAMGYIALALEAKA